jgi:hypothetical protein
MLPYDTGTQKKKDHAPGFLGEPKWPWSFFKKTTLWKLGDPEGF